MLFLNWTPEAKYKSGKQYYKTQSEQENLSTVIVLGTSAQDAFEVTKGRNMSPFPVQFATQLVIHLFLPPPL